jgi:hypothetical protein
VGGHRCAHPTLRADAGLATQVLDRYPGIPLFEDVDDLRLAELRLLHKSSWLKDARKLYLSGVRDQGELTAAPQSG